MGEGWRGVGLFIVDPDVDYKRIVNRNKRIKMPKSECVLVGRVIEIWTEMAAQGVARAVGRGYRNVISVRKRIELSALSNGVCVFCRHVSRRRQRKSRGCVNVIDNRRGATATLYVIDTLLPCWQSDGGGGTVTQLLDPKRRSTHCWMDEPRAPDEIN